MDIKNIYDAVIFASAAPSIKEALIEAVSKSADLGGANMRWANLRGANLYGADLYGADLGGADLGGADLRGADLGGADLYGANLYGADLYGANLRGADLGGKKILAMRVFSGLYEYQVWAVLYEDGTRAVRMGCLFYDLDKWETIGIRKSNPTEFPDDGSEKSENRAAAFEFAKAAALRMVEP